MSKALKRARVYPDNEGVPYYMMRELGAIFIYPLLFLLYRLTNESNAAALKKIKNEHVCELLGINLHNFKLYLQFPFVEKTLHDYMNPVLVAAASFVCVCAHF